MNGNRLWLGVAIGLFGERRLGLLDGIDGQRWRHAIDGDVLDERDVGVATTTGRWNDRRRQHDRRTGWRRHRGAADTAAARAVREGRELRSGTAGGGASGSAASVDRAAGRARRFVGAGGSGGSGDRRRQWWFADSGTSEGSAQDGNVDPCLALCSDLDTNSRWRRRVIRRT